MPYGFENLSPQELDLLVRTVWGEGSDQPELGQQGIAAVIGNRQKQQGGSISDIIRAPGQFEALTRRAQEIAALSPQSMPYQSVLRSILNMTEDPTGGATKFYAPAAQAALGRRPPAWAVGPGLDIAGHRFYGGGNVINSAAYTPTGNAASKTMPILPDAPLVFRPSGGGGSGGGGGGGVPGAAEGPMDPNYLTRHLAKGKSLEGMDPRFRDSFTRMLQEAPENIRSGLTINSGVRSTDRQGELYREAVQKYGPKEAGRHVAPPGRSFHEAGRGGFALDLGYASPEVKQYIHERAPQYGLNFPMGHEPWHIEPVGIRGNDPKVLPAEAGGPAKAMPIGTNIPGGPQMVPNNVMVQPTLADQSLASLMGDSAGADLSGIGSGKGAAGGGGGEAAFPGDSGFDEALGQAGKRALETPLPFDNLQGLGMIDPKLAPTFAVPKRIGRPKNQDLQALLAGL